VTWFRIDDTWLMHPKVQAAGAHGRSLWIAGGLHCASQLTDGRIEKHVVRVLAAQAEVPASAATKLVDVGLWIDEGDHYQMHGYLDYQPSREKVKAKRSAVSSKRSEAGRKGAAKRWQSDGKAMANGMANAWQSDGNEDGKRIANEWQTHSPIPSPIENKGCTIAAACTTVAEPAAAQAEPALITAAAAIVAERRRTAEQALDKRNPSAWEASAMAGIRAEVLAVVAPGLDATALADLVEPPRLAPSRPPDPLDRAQAAARALANRDRSCERCHGSSVWLDDDGAAHECDHRAGAAA